MSIGLEAETRLSGWNSQSSAGIRGSRTRVLAYEVDDTAGRVRTYRFRSGNASTMCVGTSIERPMADQSSVRLPGVSPGQLRLPRWHRRLQPKSATVSTD